MLQIIIKNHKQKKLIVVIVDDEPAHIEAIRRSLEANKPNLSILEALSLQDYHETIAKSTPDLVIIDLNLPDGNAISVLPSSPESGLFPFVVMTSYGNEQLAVEAIKAGALDYIVKSHEAFLRMPYTVERTFREWNFIQDRKRSDLELRDSLQRMEALLDANPDMLFVLSTDGRFVDAQVDNPDDLYIPLDQFIGKHVSEVLPPDIAQITLDSIEKAQQTNKLVQYTYVLEIHGMQKNFESRLVPCKNGTFMAIVRDITELKRLEKTLEKRIFALTRPLDDDSEISFEELFNLDDIQRLQEDFSSSAGVASIITKPDGCPITSPSNFTYLCNEIIRKTPKGCANCFKSDAALGRHNPSGPIIQTCLSGGLWDAGASITVGGHHIANWLIGQVRNESQTEEKMKAYAKEIGVNESSFIKAFYEVPSMPREQFERIARTLFTLANQLSTAAYQNIQQARFISDRKKAEEAAMKEALRRSILMKACLDGIAIINQEHQVIESNERFNEMLGYTAEEILTLHTWDWETRMTESEIRTNFSDLSKTNTIFET